MIKKLAKNIVQTARQLSKERQFLHSTAWLPGLLTATPGCILDNSNESNHFEKLQTKNWLSTF